MEVRNLPYPPRGFPFGGGLFLGFLKLLAVTKKFCGQKLMAVIKKISVRKLMAVTKYLLATWLIYRAVAITIVTHQVRSVVMVFLMGCAAVYLLAKEIKGLTGVDKAKKSKSKSK